MPYTPPKARYHNIKCTLVLDCISEVSNLFAFVLYKFLPDSFSFSRASSSVKLLLQYLHISQSLSLGSMHYWWCVHYYVNELDLAWFKQIKLVKQFTDSSTKGLQHRMGRRLYYLKVLKGRYCRKCKGSFQKCYQNVPAKIFASFLHHVVVSLLQVQVQNLSLVS